MPSKKPAAASSPPGPARPRPASPPRIQLHITLRDFLNPPTGQPGPASNGGGTEGTPLAPGGALHDDTKRDYLAKILGLRPFDLTGPAPGWTGPGPLATHGDLCDATIVPIVTGHADHDLLDHLAADLLQRLSPPGTVRQRRIQPADPAYARELILRNAVALLSGPAGLAARLRASRLTGPGASISLPLDIGTATDTIPPHLRRAVILRDTHCAFPGCDQPPAACQVHHIVPRSQRRPDQPDQPAADLHLPPPHRHPPMGLDPVPQRRRHHHRHQPQPTAAPTAATDRPTPPDTPVMARRSESSPLIAGLISRRNRPAGVTGG